MAWSSVNGEMQRDQEFRRGWNGLAAADQTNTGARLLSIVKENRSVTEFFRLQCLRLGQQHAAKPKKIQKIRDKTALLGKKVWFATVDRNRCRYSTCCGTWCS